MILRPARTPFGSGLWHFHSPTRTYTAWASELDHSGFKPERVYDDACDEGFTLVFDDGTEIVFAMNNVDKKDGDIRAWEFVSVHPGHGNFKATVFND